jgi:hypothetical protein
VFSFLQHLPQSAFDSIYFRLQIRPNSVFPSQRAFAASGTIGSALYVFGGSDAGGNLFSDLW